VKAPVGRGPPLLIDSGPPVGTPVAALVARIVLSIVAVLVVGSSDGSVELSESVSPVPSSCLTSSQPEAGAAIDPDEMSRRAASC
jgi:hypothetical protein